MRLLMICAAISIFVSSVSVCVSVPLFFTHNGRANLDIGLLIIEKICFAAHEVKIFYSSRLRAMTGLQCLQTHAHSTNMQIFGFFIPGAE